MKGCDVLSKKKDRFSSRAPHYSQLGDDPYHDYLPFWAGLRCDQKISDFGQENLLYFMSTKLDSLQGNQNTPEKQKAVKMFFEQWLSEAKSKPFLPLCRSLNYLDKQQQFVFHPKKLGHPRNRFVIIQNFKVCGNRVCFRHEGQDEQVPIQSPFLLTLADYKHLQAHPEDSLMFSSSYKKKHGGFDARQWRRDLELNTFVKKRRFYRQSKAQRQTAQHC